MALVSDTSPPPTRATAALKPPKAWRTRNLSLDRTRTFLTLLVLIHHAVIPYTHFGHTDGASWLGFDFVVLATDSFFMAMFFFLSGLFLWPSLSHRAPGVFARDRLVRLGIPFAVAAVTIIPIAYYAIALRENDGLSFTAFWWKTITVGPWPSGPLWFLWVLLIYSVVGGAMCRLFPHCLTPITRLSERGFARPMLVFAVFVVIAIVIYVPLRVWLGPNHWFEFGPFSVQESRFLLYAAYFFLGAGIGAGDLEDGVLSSDSRLAHQWSHWALASLVPYGAMWVLIIIKREILGNPDQLPNWYEINYGIAYVLFSTSIIFAIMGFFLRFQRGGWSILDPLQNDAYGIFLVHYAYMMWLQYWLYSYNLSAITKATIVFVLALLLSWVTTIALRRIPGSYRVL